MFQEQANQGDLQALVERVLTSPTLTRKGGSEKGLGWGPGPWSAQQILYPMNLWQETGVPMNLWQEQRFQRNKHLDRLNLKQPQMKTRTMVTVPVA